MGCFERNETIILFVIFTCIFVGTMTWMIFEFCQAGEALRYHHSLNEELNQFIVEQDVTNFADVTGLDLNESDLNDLTKNKIRALGNLGVSMDLDAVQAAGETAEKAKG